MAGSGSKLSLVHGQHHRIVELALALNHLPADLAKLPDQFVLQARSIRDNGHGTRYEVRREIAMIPASNALDVRGCGVLVIRARLEPEETSLWLGYRAFAESAHLIPIVEYLPFRFQIVAWRPDPGDRDDQGHARVEGWIDVPSPFQAPGKWQIGHAFCKKGNYPLVFLWRCEIPAFFEMHSHIESDHCSPLQAAWVHAWEGSVEFGHAEPGYVGKIYSQDRFAPIALGQGGVIAAKPTSEVANRFRQDLASADYPSIFPFLAQDADRIGCLMPMDMEYMHFLGYFGIPTSKQVYSMDPITGLTSKVRWYCWHSIWGFESNNRFDGINVPKYATTPASTHGEVWSWMDDEEKRNYEPWSTQKDSHFHLFVNSNSQNANVSPTRPLPFFHFDPRRYTTQASQDAEEGMGLAKAFAQPIQSPNHIGTPAFFGFKLYTALGWAPMDPLLNNPMDPHLWNPLEEFYRHCEVHQIPILNHCTPAGFYTHDRRHYYDLLDREGRICEGRADIEDNGWKRQFAREIPGPDGKWFVPKDTPGKVWWFTHHYVSAQAWKPVLKRFPDLKICLAHFGDSDHLLDNSWIKRKDREPGTTRRDLQIAFDGDRIDPNRTHRFLLDLLELIQPENQVYTDLSFVILDPHNTTVFQELFDWARIHKPILLERILWGTDWPLIGGQDPVKGHGGGEGNLLQAYAQAFREALPRMPNDFFLRACFLNPLQYLDLGRISSLVEKWPGCSSLWPWMKDMDPTLLSQTFSGDKLEVFYYSHPSLAKKLKS